MKSNDVLNNKIKIIDDKLSYQNASYGKKNWIPTLGIKNHA